MIYRYLKSFASFFVFRESFGLTLHHKTEEVLRCFWSETHARPSFDGRKAPRTNGTFNVVTAKQYGKCYQNKFKASTSRMILCIRTESEQSKVQFNKSSRRTPQKVSFRSRKSLTDGRQGTVLLLGPQLLLPHCHPLT